MAQAHIKRISLWGSMASGAAMLGETSVRIHMVNTGEVATALVQTPDDHVTYRGT